MSDAQMSDAINSVLIVEDHPDAQKLLKKVCEQTFSASVRCTNTLSGARELLEETDFNLVLLDIGLPDGSGIDLLPVIKSASPDTRCVMTTIFDDDSHLFEALRAGADGYLIKGHSPAELTNFLHDVVAGKLALSAGIAQSILMFFRKGNLKGHADSITDAGIAAAEVLTGREMEIPQLIAKGCRVREVGEMLEI